MKRNKPVISFTINKDVLHNIQVICDKESKSKSQVLNELLRKSLDINNNFVGDNNDSDNNNDNNNVVQSNIKYDDIKSIVDAVIDEKYNESNTKYDILKKYIDNELITKYDSVIQSINGIKVNQQSQQKSQQSRLSELKNIVDSLSNDMNNMNEKIDVNSLFIRAFKELREYIRLLYTLNKNELKEEAKRYDIAYSNKNKDELVSIIKEEAIKNNLM
jgi:hypothetical protein